jgi:hypothetical protein
VKLVAAILVAAVAAVVICGYATSQTTDEQFQPAIPAYGFAQAFGSAAASSSVLQMPAKPGSPFQIPIPAVKGSPRLFVPQLPKGSVSPLDAAPGVYEAWPYTCIVVVPGAHPDDRCVAGALNVDPRMPKTEPELRLIPRNQK